MDGAGGTQRDDAGWLGWWSCVCAEFAKSPRPAAEEPECACTTREYSAENEQQYAQQYKSAEYQPATGGADESTSVELCAERKQKSSTDIDDRTGAVE
jgi:hypothetical protein